VREARHDDREDDNGNDNEEEVREPSNAAMVVAYCCWIRAPTSTRQTPSSISNEAAMYTLRQYTDFTRKDRRTGPHGIRVSPSKRSKRTFRAAGGDNDGHFGSQ
jgi:hypothetical protein